jgi:hypothetical protein
MKVENWRSIAFGAAFLLEIREEECWLRIALEISQPLHSSSFFLVRRPSVYMLRGGEVFPLKDDDEDVLAALLPGWGESCSTLEEAKRLSLSRLKESLRAFPAEQWEEEIQMIRSTRMSKLAPLETALDDVACVVRVLRAFRERVEEIPDV